MEEGDGVNDLAKELTNKVIKLPRELQERFLDQARGAALALDLLAVKDAADQGPQTGQEKELRDAG